MKHNWTILGHLALAMFIALEVEFIGLSLLQIHGETMSIVWGLISGLTGSIAALVFYRPNGD